MNLTILSGHVGRNPEYVTFGDGNKIAKFSLATNERGYTRQDGTVVEGITDWHEVVVKGYLVKKVEQQVEKGTLIEIVGSIRYRDWEKPDGTKQKFTEIIVNPANNGSLFVEKSKDNGGQQTTPQPQYQQQPSQYQQQAPPQQQYQQQAPPQQQYQQQAPPQQQYQQQAAQQPQYQQQPPQQKPPQYQQQAAQQPQYQQSPPQEYRTPQYNSNSNDDLPF